MTSVAKTAVISTAPIELRKYRCAPPNPSKNFPMWSINLIQVLARVAQWVVFAENKFFYLLRRECTDEASVYI
jgi:hypothetical protein